MKYYSEQIESYRLSILIGDRIFRIINGEMEKSKNMVCLGNISGIDIIRRKKAKIFAQVSLQEIAFYFDKKKAEKI